MQVTLVTFLVETFLAKRTNQCECTSWERDRGGGGERSCRCSCRASDHLESDTDGWLSKWLVDHLIRIEEDRQLKAEMEILGIELNYVPLRIPLKFQPSTCQNNHLTFDFRVFWRKRLVRFLKFREKWKPHFCMTKVCDAFKSKLFYSNNRLFSDEIVICMYLQKFYKAKVLKRRLTKHKHMQYLVHYVGWNKR